MNTQGPSGPAQARTQAWVMWGVLLVGPLLFLAVALVLALGRDGQGLIGENADPLIPSILGGLSVLLVAKAWIIPLLIRSPVSLDAEVETLGRAGSEDRAAALDLVADRVLAAFRQRALLGWVVAEAGVNLAAITILAWGLTSLALAAAGLFVVTMALKAPTRSRILAEADRMLESHALSAHDLERTLDRT